MPHEPCYNSVRPLVVILLAVAVGVVPAEEFLAVAGDEVVVTRIDGPTVRGMLREMRAGRIVCAGPHRVEVEAGNVINLRWPGRTVHDEQGLPAVLLVNGDTLAAQAVLVDDNDLVLTWVRWPGLAPVKLPLDGVRGFVVRPPRDAAARLRMLNRLRSRAAPESNDLVILTNGDSLSGQVKSLDGTGLVLETVTGNETRIELAAVRAVSFNPELLAKPELPAGRIAISLVDGSRLTASRVEIEEPGQFRVRLTSGWEFNLPEAAVQSLRFLGGKLVYLSDVDPSREEFTPWLELRWPWRRDQNVLGGPLKLRGEPFAKGLGVHSKSELTYRLDGPYRRFHATVGIDDSAKGQGSVTFQVLVNGRRVFASEPVTGSSPPLTLPPIDVTQADTLTLVVDFAEFGDVLDQANWCDALLVK